jgi:hypothetical protein
MVDELNMQLLSLWLVFVGVYGAKKIEIIPLVKLVLNFSIKVL